ncbi:hypothetical protein CJD36_002935 [Flavipsychrobacter stenotrophus]|uniref:Uncharacterized protein n=1 Tax=Flavipsychrobacter stenotrophus TaxID=2077091 RepID=A0A2S7T1I7_9BACT|nr:hypothetical protein [Flavipsychrobacter stenotrophus]PQJ12717.1 hypothetical protein CJD36_002935 [Flavipsychrobacter stenotrophus]
MGAFNWIVLIAQCPNCGNCSTIRCQTHIASSYDGPGSDRFHDHTYELGDTMPWFDKDTPVYNDWAQGNVIVSTSEPTVSECCYGKCNSCNIDCFVVIVFNNRKVAYIESIGRIEDWPEAYYK